MRDLSICVLGPLSVQRDGRAVDLGPRLTDLLSILVLEVGRPVPARRLVTLMSGGSPSEGSAATLRSHVAHLRKLLDPVRSRQVIATVGSSASLSYRLDVDPKSVDVVRFEHRQHEGHRLLEAHQAGPAAETLADALTMWRGDPYASLDEHPVVLAEVTRLRSLHRAARTTYAKALLALGRHSQVVGLLTAAVESEPFDEELRQLLAQALYGEGRVDEAAELCRRGVVLLGERGIDAPGLQELQVRILRREVEQSPQQVPMPAPCLLPPDLPYFTGRSAEVADALARLTEPGGSTQILLVTGPAGVGKTSFAIRLAHLAAGRYPDGQLFVNLRGFEADSTAVDPADVLRQLLEVLGMPARQIPEGLDARIASFRGLLRDRKVIVVLDNARDAAQVRSLLPAGAGCATVVTSRSNMSGLVSREGADPVLLGLPSVQEALDLLGDRIGRHRVRSERAASTRIVSLCGRLPLTLAMVAARAAAYPAFTLTDIAEELTTSGILDQCPDSDTRVDVRTVFSWSYRGLSPGAARSFRLIAMACGPDITVTAAASTLAVPVQHAMSLLSELAAANLLTEHLPGRFTWHDLLRVYAHELGETDAERDGALHRFLDHCLHSAAAADVRLSPHRESVTMNATLTGVVLDEIAEGGEMAWFAAMQATLVAAVHEAARAGYDHHAWQLAWRLSVFLSRRGDWAAIRGTQTAALRAAVRLSDGVMQALSHRELSHACCETGELEAAHAELTRALRLHAQVGDRVGLAFTQLSIGWFYEVQSRRSAALRHDLRALALFRQAGHAAGLARALNAVGWDEAQNGAYERAIELCREALAIQEELGDLAAQANTWDSLGFAYQQLGDFRAAVECYQQALARNDGHRFNEAQTLEHIGDCSAGQGALSSARDRWRQAWSILVEIGHPQAEALRLKWDADPQAG